jgi:hypothetical protein
MDTWVDHTRVMDLDKFQTVGHMLVSFDEGLLVLLFERFETI